MVLYFSATGNCKYVAERIAFALGDTALSITGAGTDISLSGSEDLGIVTPTYFWELPVPVREFLSEVTIAGKEDRYIFLVATCGVTPGCCGEDARRILFRLFFEPLLIFGRCLPGEFFKNFSKITGIFIAEFLCDFVVAQGCGLQ
jgi:hypothetical protein